MINLRIVIKNLFITIIDISPRIFSLMYWGPDLVNKLILISISIRKNYIRMVFCLFCKKNLLYFIISSPGPEVQVNYCHHLASVVCKLFTFQASSPKPPGRLEPNLAGMFLGWSSTKLLFFVPVGYSIWLPRPIICSDWPKFQRSSSLKLMN